MSQSSSEQITGERVYQGIGERLIQLRGRLTQKDFAKQLGISHRTVIRYEQEERLPDAELLARLCNEFKVDPTWLLTGQQASGANYVYIPHYDLAASAGPGSFVDLEPAARVIALDRDWIRQELNVPPTELHMINVRGDSMQPTLMDGDMLLVNSDVGTIQEGIYVLRHEGLVLVKRLQRKPRQIIRVISDNPDYFPFSVDLKDESTDFAILGQVVWVGRKLGI